MGWRKCWGFPLALGALIPVAFDGCVSVGITRSRLPNPASGAGTVQVRIYETPADARAGVASSRKIVSELIRTDVAPEQSVYRGSEATWSLTDLPPGHYRLTALSVVDANGEEKPLPNQDTERFRLRPGESVTAMIVIKKAPVGAILGMSIGVAALVGGLILVAILASFDLEPTVMPDPSEGGARSPTPAFPPH
jgi:hypothetical protein